MLRKKLPYYSQLPQKSHDYLCPECGSDNQKLIGYTGNALYGYEGVFECQSCFAKFRYHNTGSSRVDKKAFLKELGCA